MSAVALARWQFTIVTIYHFFFVPLTLGLGFLVALMETLYVRTGDETYKRMTKFWGKLFVINFAMGVVTGLVQEFQFGMNWSEYSRFVGDIFGVPLAIEALLAFFLESTFLGIWLFGWEKVPKGLHAACIWLVAIGSSLSAFWILVANSWMQQPVGYVLRNGRAEMDDFLAVVTNPHVWVQFPHVLFAGVATAGFFVLGVSAYHLLRKSPDQEAYNRSFRFAVVYALIGAVLVGLVGHTQTQYLKDSQPMKLASIEALWETESPASMSLFTVGDQDKLEDIVAIKLPIAMSVLTCNNLDCEVQGIRQLQADFEERFGPGDYVPPVVVTYWAFRIMLTAGLLLIALAAVALFFSLRNKLGGKTWFLYLMLLAIPLPYLANSAGWLLAEVGRQPWIVYELMLTREGVSSVVPASTVLFSLLVYILLYSALLAANIYLLAKFARKGTSLDAAAALDSTALDVPDPAAAAAAE